MMTSAVKETTPSLKKLSDLPSASRFLDQLACRETTVSEYMKRCLQNYNRYEKSVHAWTHCDPEYLLAVAKKMDESIESIRRKIGKAFSHQLYGIPIAVKDIFNTVGMRTEHGSPIFKGYTPGNDARVVTDIRRSRGIVMGKTVTAEFSVHTPGATRNPWDVTRTPGTSSSGSTAAVACGMAPLALASQTNGSTIRPASYCGVIGYKPSFGVLPRTAMLKTTDTLDTVGILGNYLDDILKLFNVLRVKGLNYPIVNERLIPYSKSGSRWKVALIQSDYSNDLLPQISSQLNGLSDILSAQQCEVVNIDLPDLFKESYSVHTTIYHRALAYYFKREWELYPEKFSSCLSEIIKEGNEISRQVYQQACLKQVEMIQAFDRLYDQFDILMCPSALSEAPIETDQNISPDYNHLITLCHTPTISLPLMEGETGMPVGVQFIAKQYRDYLLFNFCRTILNECRPDAIS